MQDLVRRYLDKEISRRGFFNGMGQLGFTAAAANAILEPLDASEAASSTAEDEPTGGSSTAGTGGELVMAQAKAAGAEYFFSNPGSLEVGLFDALVDTPGLQHILGLHEGIVISMADGYNKVSGKPAFINVHAIAGSAQAAGQLYNASRDGSALVVTAGLSDPEVFNDDISLGGRPGFSQKELNRQFTKISWEARNAESLPLMVRRAFKVAATEPGGPVYLAISPSALQAKRVKAPLMPAERFMLRGRVRPETAAVEEAARMLVDAKRIMVVAGDEVFRSGAQAELVALSEKLGLPVAAASFHAFHSFPTQHPHYTQAVVGAGPGNPNTNAEYMKKGVDLMVFVGARDFGGGGIPQSPQIPLETRVIRIGIDTGAMGRAYQTDVALVGDVKDSLADLVAAIDSNFSTAKIKALAGSRSAEVRAFTQAQRAQIAGDARKNFGQNPMHPDELGEVLSKIVDKNAIVVSENLTARYDTFGFGYREDEQTWIGNSGVGLGWGIGASIGAKIAARDRQVICSTGDGSVMYSAPGFWTQARYSIPVLTVVWNNHNYQTVRSAQHRLNGRMASTGQYLGCYLGDPDIDFVQLANCQGVRGEKVASLDKLEPALKRGVTATRDGRPYLVEVEVARYGGGAESTWHETFSLADRRKRRV